jgi:hypothetical protein
VLTSRTVPIPCPSPTDLTFLCSPVLSCALRSSRALLARVQWYAQNLVQRFWPPPPATTFRKTQWPSSLDLMRRTLMDAESASITIIAVGHATNLHALLHSDGVVCADADASSSQRSCTDEPSGTRTLAEIQPLTSAPAHALERAACTQTPFSALRERGSIPHTHMACTRVCCGACGASHMITRRERTCADLPWLCTR